MLAVVWKGADKKYGTERQTLFILLCMERNDRGVAPPLGFIRIGYVILLDIYDIENISYADRLTLYADTLINRRYKQLTI